MHLPVRIIIIMTGQQIIKGSRRKWSAITKATSDALRTKCKTRRRPNRRLIPTAAAAARRGCCSCGQRLRFGLIACRIGPERHATSASVRSRIQTVRRWLASHFIYTRCFFIYIIHTTIWIIVFNDCLSLILWFVVYEIWRAHDSMILNV